MTSKTTIDPLLPNPKDSVMQFLKIVDKEYIKNNFIIPKKPQIFHKYDLKNEKYVIFDSSKLELSRPADEDDNGFAGKFKLGGKEYPTLMIRNAVNKFDAAGRYKGKRTMGIVLGLGDKSSGFLDETPFVSVFLRGLSYEIGNILESKYKQDVNLYAMNSTKIYKFEDVKKISKGKKNENKNQLKGFKIQFYDPEQPKSYGYEKNKAEYKDKPVVFTVNAPNKGMTATYTSILQSDLIETYTAIKKKRIAVVSPKEAEAIRDKEKSWDDKKKTKLMTYEEKTKLIQDIENMKRRVYTWDNINDYVNRQAKIRKMKVSFGGYYVTAGPRQLSLRLSVAGLHFVPGIPSDDFEDLSDQEDERLEDASEDELSDQEKERTKQEIKAEKELDYEDEEDL